MTTFDPTEPLSHEAAAALEAWHALPKGPQRRQPLMDLAARFPDQITIEWVSENAVKIHTCERLL